MSSRFPSQQTSEDVARFDSLLRNAIPTFFTALLRLEREGLAASDFTFVADALDDIIATAELFRGYVAEEICRWVEPLSDDYRFWEVTIRDATHRTRHVKEFIEWLQIGFRYVGQDGAPVLSTSDLQFIEAIFLSIERVTPLLAQRVRDVEVLYQGELWTPNALPRNVGIILNDVSRELLRKVSLTPELLHAISPSAFEELVATLLERDGCVVKLTPPSRDGGRDILAWFDAPSGSILTLVECKKWAAHRKVSVEPVRQLYGVLAVENATNAMLATTSTFTADAKVFAGAVQYRIALRDFHDISAWLTRHR